MSGENTLEPGNTEGQPGEGSETTIQTGPEGESGQSNLQTGENTDGTTNPDNKGDGHQTDNNMVYDPVEFKRLSEGLSPELIAQAEALQKGLQGNYTKKFQSISDSQKKIDAYDAFSSDPMGTMKRMAEQSGYSLTRQRESGPGNENQNSGEFDPQSWGEVLQHVEKSIMQKLSPMFTEVSNMKKTSIESQLSEIDPSWNQYEDTMRQNLNTHPTLSKDPALLYKMSVPANILESRATQAALNRMEAKVKGGGPQGGSKNKQTTDGLPDKPVSFQEAVNLAQKKLASEGIHKN